MAQSIFGAQIQAWIDKTKGNADKVVRYALLTLDTRLVNRSPVGDASYWIHPAPKSYAGGRFRGNWQVSIGSPANSILDVTDKDGSSTLAAGAAVIAVAKAGDIHYLINNLPYAQRIEKGWSRQAPIGLVAITVVEWNNIVNDAINGVNAGTSGADFAQGWSTYG
jgi:hypothetical protein